MDPQATFQESIEQAKRQPEYVRYLQVRDRVLAMLHEGSDASGSVRASDYWKEELAGFEYLLDASPLIVANLRHHCYHITGLRDYEYREHHKAQREPFERKLRALRALDHRGLFVPESPKLGGFGHVIDGALVNLDTLKYYETLIALDRAGLISSLRSATEKRSVVWEIGGGWGGLASQIKTVCPGVTYVIADLPHTLLVSATYLSALFPSSKHFIYGDAPTEELWPNLHQFDFVFLPHFALPQFKFDVALTLNTVSFQEMTTEQVTSYVAKARELRCPALYSLNRERSLYNPDLLGVSAIISQYYDTEELKILDVPYNTVQAVVRPPMSRRRQLSSALARAIRRRPPAPHNEYRHLIGRLAQR